MRYMVLLCFVLVACTLRTPEKLSANAGVIHGSIDTSPACPAPCEALANRELLITTRQGAVLKHVPISYGFYEVQLNPGDYRLAMDLKAGESSDQLPFDFSIAPREEFVRDIVLNTG